MKLTALLLALLTGTAFAEAPDAGSEYGCPEAPPSVAVDGGLFLPDLRVRRDVCLMEGCRAERDYLRAEPRFGPGWLPLIGFFATGLAGGLLLGVALSRGAHPP